MRKPRLGALARLSVLAASFGLSVGVAELAVRQVAPASTPPQLEPNPAIGYRYVPHQRTWVTNEAREFGVWFTTNAHGDPDDERTVTRDATALRVAVLGDSMVAGNQVPQSQRLTARLETTLQPPCPGAAPERRVEVLNFGINAVGTGQEWALYRSHVRRFAPDLVVVVAFPVNDVMNNSYRLEVEAAGRPAHRPFFTLAGETLTLRNPGFYEDAKSRARSTGAAGRHLRVFELGRRVWGRLRSQAAGRLLAHEPVHSAAERQQMVMMAIYDPDAQATSPAWREAWAITDALLMRLARDVEADGGSFVVAILPERRAIRRTEAEENLPWDWSWPTDHLATRARALGLSTVSLEPALAAAAHRDAAPLYFPVDGHLTPRGHRVVGQALGELLRPHLPCSAA